ncbi:hypothetical protein Tco_0762461 [Tanacetum coccineum]
MVGNTVKEMTTNFGKLDKFEGHDFRRWQKKMHFLLTTLKVVYVLTTPMPNVEDANRGSAKGECTHSKAYRFYVIEPNDSVSINSIIESRDAIFDENRFSSIPRPKDIIPNVQESQMDDHTDDVPNEILEPRRGYRMLAEINSFEDSSSTSGWVFLLGVGPISMASKMQT